MSAAYEAFRALHQGPGAFVMPNPWDGASALLLNEPLQPWKLTAFALVMAGLSLGMLWPRVRARLIPRTDV